MEHFNLCLENSDFVEFTFLVTLCLNSRSLQHATVKHFNEDNHNNKTQFEKHTLRRTICNDFPFIFHNCIYESIFINECILLISIHLFRCTKLRHLKIVCQITVNIHKFQTRWFSRNIVFFLHFAFGIFHASCSLCVFTWMLLIAPFVCLRFDELDWLKLC